MSVKTRSLAVFGLSTMIASSTFAEPPREQGLRGRLIVAPELLAAKQWPVDARRADAMRTPANVRRPLGRAITPMTEPRPELLVVVEGEDVREETPREQRVVLEGMRFVPGQLLLPRPGSVTIENKQATAVTVVSGEVVQKIEPGASGRVSLVPGEHALSVKELPYARATVRVLTQAKILPFDAEGNMPFVELSGGDYKLAFYLGAAELRTQTLSVPNNGLLFIDATVSANTVVDVTVKDAAVHFGVSPGDP
jgi:hypothetical protein